VQPSSGFFHFHHASFSSSLKSKPLDNIHTKAATLRINLNIDDTPIASRSHTHPSHSVSNLSSIKLLISSLSLGVPVPCATQCR
jgi:hypothetical protein